eukprot:TRINITY_DN5576_c0_g1_i3.p1 TRINITY_DN5576_c0_g1~~TRINITY_DN5576_c0_g1_i3.p1  ORF type:complete len:637 (-),score=174.12 TRINITY_DN5576_c0_g1_i3:1042-2739(-)
MEQGQSVENLSKGHVGYSIRFDDQSSPLFTKIKFLTDGLLIRETLSDPLLTQYSVIMVDEAHELSINTEILLGLLKKIQKKRADLRIIIASATLDYSEFQKFFLSSENPTKIISLDGSSHPIDVLYVDKPVRDYLQATAETVIKIHKFEEWGDILAFLPGKEEIDAVCSILKDQLESDPSLDVIPLFSGLPMADQMKVFAKAKRKRKAIISTNVAETSLTIEGIVYVVDSGFVRQKSYNPISNTESLTVTTISKSSADQRAGRAGRTAPGKCFRLYPETTELVDKMTPETQRSDISLVILQLKALGIEDILKFPFLHPPPIEVMTKGLENLFALGALDEQCKLSQAGQIMAELALDPKLSRMLLSSVEFECTEEILSIVSVLSVQSIFLNSSAKSKLRVGDSSRRRFWVQEGDLITLLNIYNEYVEKGRSQRWCSEYHLNHKMLQKVDDVRKNLAKTLKFFKLKIESCGQDIESLQKCITAGLFLNAAQLQRGGAYKLIRGKAQTSATELRIHPSSVLYNSGAQWIVFYDVVLTTGLYMRQVSTIHPLWLSEVAEHYFQLSTAQH